MEPSERQSVKKGKGERTVKGDEQRRERREKI